MPAIDAKRVTTYWKPRTSVFPELLISASDTNGYLVVLSKTHLLVRNAN